MDPEESPAAPRRRTRRIAAIAAVVVLVLLAGAALCGWLALPSWIVRQARARGVLIEPRAVEIHLGRVVVRDARVRLVDVRGFEAHVASLVIELEGLTPKRAIAEGASLVLRGKEPIADVPRWFAAHGAVGSPDRLAVSVRDAGLAWWPADAAETERAWIELAGMTLDPVSLEGALRGARIRVLGRDLGALDPGYAWTEDVLHLGLPGDRLDRAVLHVDVTRKLAIEAHLDPVPLAAITALTSAQQPPEGATLSARASFAIPTARTGGFALEGSVAGEIIGWTPPHPIELDGILFGDRTKVTASVRVDDRFARAELDDVHVTAGALALRGQGRIALEDPARVELHLNGAVPCTELARSAALARLGQNLGELAGNFARSTLTGSVLVHVDVAADPRRLDQARIDRTTTVKCKTRPLDL